MKKFRKLNEDRNNIEERYEAEKDLYSRCHSKVDELVNAHLILDKTSDWGVVGSLAHVNEELINLIEGWDENMANDLRKKGGSND